MDLVFADKEREGRQVVLCKGEREKKKRTNARIGIKYTSKPGGPKIKKKANHTIF
jgi:hypothetical protein